VLISLSLGFLNLLPIPILDGGQIVFQLVEVAEGQPVVGGGPRLWDSKVCIAPAHRPDGVLRSTTILARQFRLSVRAGGVSLQSSNSTRQSFQGASLGHAHGDIGGWRMNTRSALAALALTMRCALALAQTAVSPGGEPGQTFNRR